MKEKIIQWIVLWLLNNIDKATVDKLMNEYVLPWIAKEKNYFYATLEAWAKSSDEKWDDFIVQVIKWICDRLTPGGAPGV